MLTVLTAMKSSSPISRSVLPTAMRRSVEEIIGKLWEAEVALAQGETVAQVCRGNGVPDHTFYRWRQQYGGLRIDQARRLREMEAENARLRRAVADLTLDNQILREAAGGNF